MHTGSESKTYSMHAELVEYQASQRTFPCREGSDLEDGGVPGEGQGHQGVSGLALGQGGPDLLPLPLTAVLASAVL